MVCNVLRYKPSDEAGGFVMQPERALGEDRAGRKKSPRDQRGLGRRKIRIKRKKKVFLGYTFQSWRVRR
jgi:hypothetical protein